MALINKPYTFSAGATIVAAEHNSNADTIYNDYNGNITNANLSASAAITDSKLAQLTTAGKVSGASLTLLGSIPSGGGVVPIANLATGTPDGTLFVRDDGTLASPVNAATQAEQETGTSVVKGVTPGRQQYHASAAKAWCFFNGATAGTNAPTAGYNVTSVTRNGTGDYSVNLTTAFSSANYAIVCTGRGTGGSDAYVSIDHANAPTASVIRIKAVLGGAISDITGVHLVAFGDQ